MLCSFVKSFCLGEIVLGVLGSVGMSVTKGTPLRGGATMYMASIGRPHPHTAMQKPMPVLGVGAARNAEKTPDQGKERAVTANLIMNLPSLSPT